MHSDSLFISFVIITFLKCHISEYKNEIEVKYEKIIFVLLIFIVLGFAGYSLYSWLLPPKDIFEENIKRMAKHGETDVIINDKEYIKVIRINGDYHVLRKDGEDINSPHNMTGITYKQDLMVTRHKDGRFFVYDTKNNHIFQLKKNNIEQHRLNKNFKNLD